MLNTYKHLHNAITDYQYYFKGVKATKGIGLKNH